MADFAKHIYMLLESEMEKKEAELKEEETISEDFGQLVKDFEHAQIREDSNCNEDDDESEDCDDCDEEFDEDCEDCNEEDDEKKSELEESAQQKLELLAQIQKDIGKAELPTLKRVYKLVSGQENPMVPESAQAKYDTLTMINANILGCPISVLKRIAKIVADRDFKDPKVDQPE